MSSQESKPGKRDSGYAITEWLWLYSSSFEYLLHTTPEESAEAIRNCNTVVVQNFDDAREVLTALGGTPEGIDYRIQQTSKRILSRIWD